MKFFQWGGERPREPEPPRERRGGLNRERLIAKMVACQDMFSTIRHLSGGGETQDSNVKRLEERYQALRSIVVDTSFETSTIDELIGVVYGKELAAVGQEKKTLENLRLSLTMDDAIANTTIRNLSHSVPDALRKATNYGRILDGIDGPIGYLPEQGSKKQPIYLGSQVRYSKQNGDSGIARIVKFTDPKGVFEDPAATAFVAKMVSSPHFTASQNADLTPFFLRFSEIIDVYDQ